MVFDPTQLLELTPNESMGTMLAGCSVKGARSVIKYVIKDPFSEDITQMLTNVLGKVELHGEGVSDVPYIPRTIPKSHPLFPWIYASSINSIQGVGKNIPGGIPANLLINTEPIPRTTLYDAYMVEIEYTPREYRVLPTDKITTFINDPVNNNPFVFQDTIDGVHTYRYVNEWLRWTTHTLTPANNRWDIPQGNMHFFDTGIAAGTPYQAKLSIPNPDMVMKMMWHEVPYRYYSSPRSYLRRMLARINQKAWNLWEPGQLLFAGCVPVRRYKPPVPEFFDVNLTRADNTEFLCDFELTFGVTDRKTTTAGNPPLQANNYLKTGWNLMPHIKDRKYHYTANPVSGMPSFYSAPFELLFTDPDYPQPGFNANQIPFPNI